MTLTLSRALLFAAGFALWAAFSFGPGSVIREGWDMPLYWQLGVPLVLGVQLALGCLSPERVLYQPLWILAGHLAAMITVHPTGMSLALAPLAIVFIALPAYPILLALAALGRRFAPRH